MKKRFLVEVEYEELEENIKNNGDVFYDVALEVAIENLMYGYLQTNSIKEKYEVNVEQLDKEPFDARKTPVGSRLINGFFD